MSIEQVFLSIAYASHDHDDAVCDSVLGGCSDTTETCADFVAACVTHIETFEDVAEHAVSKLDPHEEGFKEKRKWLRDMAAKSKTCSLGEVARLAVLDWFENYEGADKTSSLTNWS